MSKVKIQINGTKEDGTSRTHQEIRNELERIAKETGGIYNFEGLHPEIETNPFIWVDYSGGKVLPFARKLDECGLTLRFCSHIAGIPGIDSLPT